MSTFTFEPKFLRHALGHFATGVTIITTVGPEGEPVGTTATAVSSLSLDPPLVLACLGWHSATLRAILGYRAFAINVLAHHQEEVSSNFARRGAEAAWDGVAHDHWPSGTPRLNGILAGIECTLENVITGGDHEILIGRVLDAVVHPDGERPLLHWRGEYGRMEGV